SHRIRIAIRGYSHKNLCGSHVYAASIESHYGQVPVQFSGLPFLCLRHGSPPLMKFGNEPGVQNRKISQAGSSQHKQLLCVTNVIAQGPGIKFWDGLASRKHKWENDLHLPLPQRTITSIRDELGTLQSSLLLLGRRAG